MLEMVGLASLAERMPAELSGGEQQRVALARALVRRPRALLLDEPFSSLDASLRGAVREEVHALLREHEMTTVLVTHDQEEALSLADVVAVLRDGVIVQRARPAELYERPADEALARFLGEVNVLDARIERGLARTALGTLELREGADVRGAEAAVMLRPEQIEVHAHGSEGEGGEPGVRGQVEECRYYGHDAMLTVRTERLESALLARVDGAGALPVGTPVNVRARGPVSVLGSGLQPTP